MTEKAKGSFIGGAAILALAGLLGKAIGAVYRIWLTYLVGTEGVGIYQKAYPVYAFLLVISSAGIPTAIAKLVSERESLGDAEGARRVFRVAYRLLLVIGSVTALSLFLLAPSIAAAYHDPSSAWCFRLIAPALLLVSLLSAYRGYYQGRQRMRPTAISQIIEQIGKLVAGYALIRVFLPYGLAWGAAGAILGITMSEAAALLFAVLYHARERGRHRGKVRAGSGGTQADERSVLRNLTAIAVPITLGASIMPLVGNIDSALVVRRLMDIGYDLPAANRMFGTLTGIVNPLVNMPAVLSLALSMSLVPALSAAAVAGDRRGVRGITQAGLKISLLVGLPCAAGMFVLAEPIVAMLFGRGESAQTIALAVGMLRTMAVGVLFLTLLQTTTGILQGLGRIYLPMLTLAVGAMAKIAINYFLVGDPNIGVRGAPVGTLVCYGTAAMLNAILATRASHTRFPVMGMIVKPLIATFAMVIGVCGFLILAGDRMSTVAATVGSVAVGIAVYAVMLILTRVLNESEWAMIPGGGRLLRFLKSACLLPAEDRAR